MKLRSRELLKYTNFIDLNPVNNLLASFFHLAWLEYRQHWRELGVTWLPCQQSRLQTTQNKNFKK